MNIPEADAVYLPSPSVARLKIHAHITLVQRPQSTKKSAQMGTVTMLNDDPVNTGIDTDELFPKNIAMMMNVMASVVVQTIKVRLEILSAIKPVQKRPINIRNQ